MAKQRKPMTQKEMEKSSLDLNKLLSQQQFGSIEEMQAFMNQFIVGKTADQFGTMLKKTDKDKAVDLVYEAHEAPSKAKAKKLISQALALNPDCSEAHAWLGGEERDPRNAIPHFQKALECAKKDIGDRFDEYKGHFWGIHETRPYMNALSAIGECFFAIEDLDSAIQIFLEMLELNPNDNQGNRYRLAPFLVLKNRFSEYEKLYKNYKGDFDASWQYTYAIFLFKKEGDTKKSVKALAKAIEANHHVILYLAGAKEPPKQLPPFVQPGEESEALHALNLTDRLWAEEGVIDWIGACLSKMSFDVK